MKTIYLLIISLTISTFAFSQNKAQQAAYRQIPLVHSNIVPDEEGKLTYKGHKLIEKETFYTLDNIRIEPKGTSEGIKFDFGNSDFNGTIYYGLFSADLPTYPQTVFFARNAKIENGVAEINIAQTQGKFDIADWERTAKLRLGYRITNSFGKIIYDGKINVEGTGPFSPGLSIVEGPFLNRQTESGIYISFTTSKPCSPYVEVNGQQYRAASKMMNPIGDIYHEIRVHHLEAGTKYKYTVVYGDYHEIHDFTTAPEAGSRKAFVYAFASDSRAGQGGGERNIYGTNAYVMKKMAALAVNKGVAFFQFTGDMINGYSSNIGETNLQYANWKRNIEPFWHYIPFNVGFGNHEALVNVFDDGSSYGVQVDKFPYSNKSAERIFANQFVNPENGPESEDGSAYDPKPGQLDFPSYSENVFYYTYDNLAMIVLNSNYWYAPSNRAIPEIGGNPHGYIMDNQLKWLERTIQVLDDDKNIDHIFVTIHTPAFPNGGHSGDDMWYRGNNHTRPSVAGKPVEKGILERRDEFLNIIINKSEKVVALLCGDEHNYSRLKLTNKTSIYRDGYSGKKLKISRPFWQITNGSAGAPYYGQEELPWSESVEKFSTQYALMLFYVDGEKITLEVVNPDTFEDIEKVVLTE